MIVYRPINASEVDDLTDFAMQALPENGAIAKCRDKIRACVDAMVAGFGHFQMAAFKDGKVVAGLALCVAEMPFHRGCEGHVIFCFSKEPGCGYNLLRRMMRWVADDMRVRRVVWAMSEGFDRRMLALARRIGFGVESPMAVYYKG